jgi:hypothetical protein
MPLTSKIISRLDTPYGTDLTVLADSASTRFLGGAAMCESTEAVENARFGQPG